MPTKSLKFLAVLAAVAAVACFTSCKKSETETPPANAPAGDAYIFHVSSESSWVNSSTPTAMLSDPVAGWFSWSLALSADGTTALIGAPDSTDGIAGVCDPSGLVLGLMPHPERNTHPTHHPAWTRQSVEELATTPAGLRFFQNAVAHVKAGMTSGV